MVFAAKFIIAGWLALPENFFGLFHGLSPASTKACFYGHSAVTLRIFLNI
jgi:hypothetical protein